jgi:enamine deaminase RidA (YjgF/YER057c/UK114 family)
MTHLVETRLGALGVALPSPAAAVANYVPFARTGNLVVISGQLPLREGAILHPGLVGRDLDVETAQDAARACAVNLLAQLRAAVEGDWDRVVRCVRLGGFIACTPDFKDHAKIVNGASDLIVGALGDAGRHARTSIGVSALPLGAAVEVEALFEVR